MPKNRKRAPGPTKEKILDPAELDPYKELLLFARLVVEGWFAGKHRSLDFGSSAEFEEYEQYVPGFPVSQIDWRVYARSRDLVVRRHREEKDMTGYLLVDTSGSMAYRSGGVETKLVRAAKIASALAYLMHRQGDKSALALFHTELEGYLPPGGTKRHLFDLVSRLETSLQDFSGRTHAHSAVDLCVPLFKKKGCLILISDFMTDLDLLFDSLAQFQHRRYKILLLHVMDPHERDLPDVSLARFLDLETKETIQVAPDEIRRAYVEETDRIMNRLKDESVRRGIHYQLLDTSDPYRTAIEAWLDAREGIHQGGRA